MMSTTVASVTYPQFGMAVLGGRSPAHRERSRVADHIRRAELLMARASRDRQGDRRQRWIRLLLLEQLAAYRARSRFPQNHDFIRPTPYFIDRFGTRCALAHLLELCGATALVQRVAAHRNNATVSELADDPELVSWLVASGLGLDEAAAIQPTYCETYTVARECLCSPSGADSWSHPPLPAQAVLEARVLDVPEPHMVVRVEVVAVHGDSALTRIGDQLNVRVENTAAAILPGHTVLVPVHTEEPAYQNVRSAFLVGADGRYHCDSQYFDDPAALSVDTLVSAVQAEDCQAAIEAQGGDGWQDARKMGCDAEGRCQLTASGVEGYDLTLGILLSLIALRVWPRRQLR